MSKYLLIDMKGFLIASRHETPEEAEAAKEAAAPPTHLILEDSDWESLSGMDLTRIYNNLPGVVSPVKRFTDHATGVRRIVGALGGVITEEPEDTATLTTEEKATVAKKTAKKTVKKTKTKKAPAKKKESASGRAVEDRDVSITAAGKKDNIRLNEGTPRKAVLMIIRAAETMKISAVEKKMTDLTHGQVMGCIGKLIAKGYVKFG